MSSSASYKSQVPWQVFLYDFHQMLRNPGAERNYVNISFYYYCVFITFLLWFFIASYNTGKYGDPTWRWGFLISCLCSHALYSIHVNYPWFLRQREERRLHAVCNYFSHSFTARDTMWDLQMLNNLSLHQLKQKMLTICNFNLFILKQCKAMQRYRRAVGESTELTLHTGLLCETEELRIMRI